MTESVQDIERRIETLKAELEQSEKSACFCLDRALRSGPQEGGLPARYWAREIAVLRGAISALEESKARVVVD